MPISLVVGPPNSGRAPELRRRLEPLVDHDPVLVVPTGDDAARFERELCGGGAVLGVSIRTFASLFEAVARAAGASLDPPLSEPQRRALLGAATSATPLRLLARSARRPGFVPALDALIAELQAALVSPHELDAAARELEDGDYERELAALYGAYVELRERAGRSDPGSRAAAARSALRARPAAWRRPVLVYGFDDLSAVQVGLLGALGAEAEVVVAVNYGDRDALNVLAGPLARLHDELGAEVACTLRHDPGYTERRSLRHLDRWLFEPGAARVREDGGVTLLECGGELGEVEAVAAEIARLLADGVPAEEISVVVRDAAARGAAISRVLGRFDIPVAVEAQGPLDRTAVGSSLIALCRAAGPDGAPADLLAHLRADPAMDPGAADWLERRIRRARPESIDAAIAGWKSPPRHLAALRDTPDAAARLRLLARIASELAESPHRGAAPVGTADSGPVPFDPLELRAAAIAAGLLEELAEVGELPGCRTPDLNDAIAALEAARVPLWRGPADGRVRVLDPHRVRAGRARHLFCLGLEEGEFPRRGAHDPLLSEERRARLGLADLVRRDPQDWERYLFHACVSRPTDGLWLAWRSTDDEGAEVARSPFVDEVLDLIEQGPGGEHELIRRRGLEQVAFSLDAAPSERELARALVLESAAEPDAGLAGLELPDGVAARTAELVASIPDPRQRPGPLAAEPVLAELGARSRLSASSLEGWVECSYRWFVGHELRPQRLDPDPDPMRLGSAAHSALQRLYAEPPGEDSIPRAGDLGRWQRRLGELLDEAAREAGIDPEAPADSLALARLRIQINRFLADEAASESELRPRADLLEAKFGFEDGAPPLELGEVTLRGAIDRIDVGADGRTALVRDYKTSRKMPGRRSWEKEGKLQLQLYVLAAREALGLEPVGGVYQPLGGRGKSRRPRGILLEEAVALGGLDVVKGDPCEADDFEDELERARGQADASAARMRRGEITRDPLGGRCPRWCTYQPICRLERAVGLEEEGEGGAQP